MFAPTGHAIEVDGGYRLSGRWNYVTGAPHATMIVLGFVVVGPDGAQQTAETGPLLRWAVVSAAAVTIETTWHDAAGMRGSGSHDLTAEDVFVPTAHTLAPFTERPQAEGTLYRMPWLRGIPLLTGVPLGVARRALDELNALCRTKVREMTAAIEDQDVQIRFAEAEAALRASRGFVFESLERIWADVQMGEAAFEPSVEFTLAAQYAMRSAVHAANLAFEIAGASASKTGSVIQRCWRDVNVMSQHVSYSRARWREVGQGLLGARTDLPNF
jgi:alkylation response protein AidB-like acyl-CoA dehydrogenase